MNSFLRSCRFFTLYMLIPAAGLFAQADFNVTPNTGNNMTVLVQASIVPIVNGSSIENGDIIGVFTPAGRCAGAVIWNGANTAITIWGDNERTPETDGMKVGDTLKYKVLDSSRNREFAAVVAYSSGRQIYSVDGIAVLSSLLASTCAITFNKNDADATGAMGVQTVANLSSTNLFANAFSKAGWTFAGWAAAPDGAVVYADKANFTIGTAGVILYAKWTIHSYTLSLAHSIGGASAVADKDTVVNYGDTVHITAAPISGTVFKKWRISAGAAVLVDSTALSAKVVLTNSNATLTAVYEKSTGLLNQSGSLPTAFDLSGNAGGSLIRFAVPRGAGYSAVSVRVRLFDARGKLLSTLVNKKMQAGYYELKMATGDNTRLPWAICIMDAVGFSSAVKIMRMK